MFKNWTIHFHVGVRKTPLTVYRVGQLYEVWYGKHRWVNLSKSDAAKRIGYIILRAKGNLTR